MDETDYYNAESLIADIKKTINIQEKICVNDSERLVLAAMQMNSALKIYRELAGNIETRKILQECLEIIPDKENRHLN